MALRTLGDSERLVPLADGDRETTLPAESLHHLTVISHPSRQRLVPVGVLQRLPDVLVCEKAREIVVCAKRDVGAIVHQRNVESMAHQQRRLLPPAAREVEDDGLRVQAVREHVR